MHVIEFITTHKELCWRLTLEHIWIVALALFLSIIIGVPIGIAITRNEQAAKKVGKKRSTVT